MTSKALVDEKTHGDFQEWVEEFVEEMDLEPEEMVMLLQKSLAGWKETVRLCQVERDDKEEMVMTGRQLRVANSL